MSRKNKTVLAISKLFAGNKKLNKRSMTAKRSFDEVYKILNSGNNKDTGK